MSKVDRSAERVAVSSSETELRIFFEGVTDATRLAQLLALFEGVDLAGEGKVARAKDDNGR